jgi:hypothetical protein
VSWKGVRRAAAGTHGHDDVANAACGASVLAMTKATPLRIHPSVVERAGRPLLQPPLIAFDNGRVYRGGGW